MDQPKLSIITINLNNKDGLQRTIDSVLCQTYTDFEYIIIDGKSSDESIEIIKRNEVHLAYWISEPDTGVYNAMNKGIHQAKGEYLLMLNSGDTLADKTIIETIFNLDWNYDIIYGDILWEVTQPYITTFPDTLTFSYFLYRSLGHQSAFIRKNLHHKFGFYIEHNSIVSDWCFFIKTICAYNCSYKHFPFVIAHCNRDGISCDPQNSFIIEQESKTFLELEFPLFLNDYEIARNNLEELTILKEKNQEILKRKENSIGFKLKSKLKRIPFLLSIIQKIRYINR